jgi:hypothetical protein
MHSASEDGRSAAAAPRSAHYDLADLAEAMRSLSQRSADDRGDESLNEPRGRAR